MRVERGATENCTYLHVLCLIIEHVSPVFLIDQRDAGRVIAGHHTLAQRALRESALEEQPRRGEPEALQRYAAALKARRNGHGVRVLRRLLQPQ